MANSDGNDDPACHIVWLDIYASKISGYGKSCQRCVDSGDVSIFGKPALYFAAFLYASVLTTLVIISLHNQQFIPAVFFISGFATMILPPLLKAIQKPIGPLIGKAVKSGVIGLILMDATWAAAFGLPLYALAIALLLPLSILLARLFAVT